MSNKYEIQIDKIKDKAYRFALKMLNNNQQDAEDVVQDLFEKLINMKDRFIEYDNKEAFAMKITKNLCLDKFKHDKIIVKKHQEISLIQKSTTNIAYDTKNVAEIIKQLITELPQKQKMIMHLRDVEELEYNEIEDIMEIDINAIRMNLSRARSTIREKLIKIMNYGL